MDEIRKIRFLVAPALFYASIAWGTWLDPHARASVFAALGNLKIEPITGLLAALLGGGIALFATGFVIGTLTYTVFRVARMLWFRSWSGQHEVALDPTALKMLWDKFELPGEATQAEKLYVGATFDFSVLHDKHKGVHEWLFRRGSAVIINNTSIAALILSLLIGHLAGIQSSKWWVAPAVIMMIAFSFASQWAWRDGMGMLAFQARLYKPTNGQPRDGSHSHS
jgi:hypothetical protein